jgi:hypothetical protein
VEGKLRVLGVEKKIQVLDMVRERGRLRAGRSRIGMGAVKTALCVVSILALLLGCANGQDTVLWRVEFPEVTEVRDQPFVECFNEVDPDFPVGYRPCESDNALDCRINLPRADGSW